MKFFRLIFSVTLVLLSFIPAGALQIPQVTLSLKDVIDTVERPFLLDSTGTPQLQSIRASFFQSSTIAAKQKEIRADGQMYLKPATGSEPLMFRFEYYRPATQEVVCDGRTLWIYLPENRQVILSDVSDFFDPTRFDSSRTRGINFLQGLGRISKDFTITFAREMTDPVGNYKLELRPNRASATIERLFITVHRDAVLGRIGGRPVTNARPAKEPDQHLFPILATTVIDHDGNITTIEFSNIEYNNMQSETLFRFDVPPGVQVVRPPTGR